MTKPRIKRLAPAKWQCADEYVARCGKNWQQAYSLWLHASLRDAQTRLQPKKPLGRPKKAAGAPITVKSPVIRRERVRAPMAQSYPESMVQTVPGTVAHPEYAPAKGLQLNRTRAAAAQSPLVTPRGVGNNREFHKDWGNLR